MVVVAKASPFAVVLSAMLCAISSIGVAWFSCFVNDSEPNFENLVLNYKCLVYHYSHKKNQFSQQGADLCKKQRGRHELPYHTIPTLIFF